MRHRGRLWIEGNAEQSSVPGSIEIDDELRLVIEGQIVGAWPTANVLLTQEERQFRLEVDSDVIVFEPEEPERFREAVAPLLFRARLAKSRVEPAGQRDQRPQTEVASPAYSQSPSVANKSRGRVFWIGSLLFVVAAFLVFRPDSSTSNEARTSPGCRGTLSFAQLNVRSALDHTSLGLEALHRASEARTASELEGAAMEAGSNFLAVVIVGTEADPPEDLRQPWFDFLEEVGRMAEISGEVMGIAAGTSNAEEVSRMLTLAVEDLEVATNALEVAIQQCG